MSNKMENSSESEYSFLYDESSSESDSELSESESTVHIVQDSIEIVVLIKNLTDCELTAINPGIDSVPANEMRRILLRQEEAWKFTDTYGNRRTLRMIPYEDEDELPRVHVEYPTEVISLNTTYGEYREGVPRIVSVRIRPAIGKHQTVLPEPLLRELVKQTYFDPVELQKLYEAFVVWCHPDSGLSHQTFLRLFPGVQDKVVLNSIFHAFDRLVTPDKTIDFKEFAIGLSTMCRGNPNEKAQLAFEIFDLNNDGCIEREEMLRISIAVAKTMEEHGLTRRDFGDPNVIINNVFLRTSEDAGSTTPEYSRRVLRGVHRPLVADESDSATPVGEQNRKEFFHSQLNRKNFIARALHEPDLLECFGLFDIFHWMILENIENERIQELNVKPDTVTSGQATLTRKYRGGIFGRLLQRLTRKRVWFQLKNGFLAYGKSPHKHFSKVIDLHETQICSLYPRTREFVLRNSNASWIMKASTEQEAYQWMYAIRMHRRRPQRFRSFAPVRHDTYARWFVNAESYFDQLIRVFANVKQTLFIAGWHVSPHLYLKRPTEKNNEKYRLDYLLKSVAERGVKVSLLMYDAPNVLNLHSRWAAKVFTKLHPNIEVLLHPTSLKYYLWSHHQKIVIADEAIAFIGGIDLCFMRFDNRSFKITDPDESYFPGRDYGNLYLHAESDGPGYESVIDRKEHPRMPWHDVHVQLTGSIVVDIAINFLQRWNHALQSGGLRIKHRPGPLLSMHTSQNPAHNHNDVREDQIIDISQMNIGFPVPAAQIIRSASYWSTGCKIPERSVYKAYQMAIQRAEHYIFIENQFFISSINRASPKNKVLEALYRRLCRAISERQVFRCIVVIPLYPGGAVTEGSNRFMLKYTFRSINRGGGSLLEMLAKKFPNVDLSEYIKFFTLRQKAILEGKILHESVYIHSKVMIVDDRVAIIASANINDRSMLGTRDSEIGVIIEGDDMDSVINHRKTRVNRFAHSLRLELWKDFLQLNDSEDYLIKDPVCSSTYGLLCDTARSNSRLYVEIFGSMPEVTTRIDQIKREPVQLTPEREEKYNKIRGVLVDFPLDFLKEESMNIRPFEKEKMVPRMVFL